MLSLCLCLCLSLSPCIPASLSPPLCTMRAHGIHDSYWLPQIHRQVSSSLKTLEPDGSGAVMRLRELGFRECAFSHTGPGSARSLWQISWRKLQSPENPRRCSTLCIPGTMIFTPSSIFLRKGCFRLSVQGEANWQTL